MVDEKIIFISLNIINFKNTTFFFKIHVIDYVIKRTVLIFMKLN